VRLVGLVLVVMLFTTALVPLLRRFGGVPSSGQADAFGRRAAVQRQPQLTLERLADEVAAIAERLDGFDASPEVRHEAQALRDLVARVVTRDR
jgi:hypothetical protein